MRFITVAILIFGLVGCGSSNNSTTKEDTVVTPTPQSPSTQDKEKQPPSLPVI